VHRRDGAVHRLGERSDGTQRRPRARAGRAGSLGLVRT
jgi:hypothetical protein